MVENSKRGRGRPRTFDENEALDRAIELFWAKGYDATSLDDLSSAMGVARPSLYLAFGDKEALFLRALGRYAETSASKPLCAMEEAGTAREGIEAYLREIVRLVTGDPTRSGCLLGPVACAVDSEAVRAFVVQSMDSAEARVAERLRRAVEAGELPADFPIRKRARRAINAMLAISMRSKHGASEEDFLEDVEDGVLVTVVL